MYIRGKKRLQCEMFSARKKKQSFYTPEPIPLKCLFSNSIEHQHVTPTMWFLKAQKANIYKQSVRLFILMLTHISSLFQFYSNTHTRAHPLQILVPVFSLHSRSPSIQTSKLKIQTFNLKISKKNPYQKINIRHRNLLPINTVQICFYLSSSSKKTQSITITFYARKFVWPLLCLPFKTKI